MARPARKPVERFADIVANTGQLATSAGRPLEHYQEASAEAFSLLTYFERKLKQGSTYPSVAKRHTSHLQRLLLLEWVECFERFLKELASVCADQVVPLTLDDRLQGLSASPQAFTAHFEGGTLGQAFCESAIWTDCDQVNTRFERLLAHPLEPKNKFLLFPKNAPKNQAGSKKQTDESFRYFALELLWQLRHSIVHNVGVLTRTDAAKVRLLAKRVIEAPRMLEPTKADLLAVKAFLDETAVWVNTQVGARLADVLSGLLESDPSLFVREKKETELSGLFSSSFQISAKP